MRLLWEGFNDNFDMQVEILKEVGQLYILNKRFNEITEELIVTILSDDQQYVPEIQTCNPFECNKCESLWAGRNTKQIFT